MTARCVWMAALVAATAIAGCSGGEDAEMAPETVDEFHVVGYVLTMALVPITGATVSLDPSGLTATTDDVGGFELGPLPAGPQRLLVKAKGYADHGQVVTVRAGIEDLYLKLEAVSRDVPYSEVQKFIGYVECSYAAHVGPVPMGNFGCMNVVDLVVGTDLSNDDDEFTLDLGGPGFKGVMIEMFWEEQATGPYWSGYLRDPVGVGGGVGLEGQYWSGSSTNPLRALVVAGTENAGAYSGDVFHPDENVSRTYDLSHAGAWDDSKPVDVSVTLRTTVEIFVTSFYYKLPGEGYSAVDCDGC